MFDYKNASFNKAEEYFEAAEVLIDHELINSGAMICIQTSAECYLSSIIEAIHEKPIDNVFQKNLQDGKTSMRVPHDLCKLYNKIYSPNEPLNELLNETPYNLSFKRQLNAIFLNYQAMRHAKDPSTAKGRRMVSEHDILSSFSSLEEVREFASLVHEKILEKEIDGPRRE